MFGPAFPWTRGDEGRRGEGRGTEKKRQAGRPASWCTRACDLGKSRIRQSRTQ